jgi:ABC-2 type transport system ATP-binding protein
MTEERMNVTQSVAELRGVSKRFGSVVALDNLSLDIQRGELLALLGANGAGKTTAVRMLLGLSRPNSGTATVFGNDPTVAANRMRTGAMLQIGKVPETLRVVEHIELFSSYYPNPLPRAEVVKIAGLKGLERRLFGELSGGQKQRVLFALAICGRPDLLILDEPTLGLDVETRRSMWTEIRDYVSRGGSVLLTTHHLEEADALASRVVVIDRGRVLMSGTAEEIKRHAAARRIRCSTSLPLERLRMLPDVASASQLGDRIEILTANPEAVTRELLRHDASLANLEVTNAGLEEAFLALTNKEKEVA